MKLYKHNLSNLIRHKNIPMQPDVCYKIAYDIATGMAGKKGDFI
jgi:hypothetical protein